MEPGGRGPEPWWARGLAWFGPVLEDCPVIERTASLSQNPRKHPGANSQLAVKDDAGGGNCEKMATGIT